MKKKLLLILFVIVLVFSMALPVLAAEGEGFSEEYYRVADMAEVLSAEDEASLIQKLDEIRVRQSVDVVVATTLDLQGFTIEEYADYLYDECEFGYGSEKDGVLLFVSTETHDWYISTCGYGITAFTDAGIAYIGEQITPFMSEGDYASAFNKYAELCDEFVTKAKSGEPYDRGNLPRKELSLVWIPISVVIGFVLAKIIVGNMKGQLKSVRSQAAANSYVRNGSMNITENRDLFLYNTVTKTPRPKQTSSSGSSTHTSSSGTTHGGGGGKF